MVWLNGSVISQLRRGSCDMRHLCNFVLKVRALQPRAGAQARPAPLVLSDVLKLDFAIVQEAGLGEEPEIKLVRQADIGQIR
ncbi:hypothetical protein EV281_101990 [Rhizobium sp. BK418]|nr:hypothetical protein EV281_101990 [Rhizobium sp. BK418]